MFKKGRLCYEGKGKRLFDVSEDSSKVWVEYKNSLTAFNAEKKGEFEGKGRLNCLITSKIYQYLEKSGIKTHLVETIGESEMICERLKIIPIEVVVRNTLAGSTAKRFGIEEGTVLRDPLVEFYYKSDKLGDPFMSSEQALSLGFARNEEEVKELKKNALIVNKVLIDFFDKAGIQLIDFKLEYGRNNEDQIVLGDEITPDSCRLWDKESREKLDKDRFRRDLGGVDKAYQEVLDRIEKNWGEI